VANSNSLRIIGGSWRSRRLQFYDSPKIRPTPDRVRETLFNWLAGYIHNANCLDLFAGSGALGFEAVSRGAAQVTLIENDAKIVNKLKQQKALFEAENIEIKHQNAVSFLQKTQQKYDVIFLDPPFASALLEQVVSIIIAQQRLTEKGVLYVEEPSMQESLPIFKTLACGHEKVSGEVRYALYSQNS